MTHVRFFSTATLMIARRSIPQVSGYRRRTTRDLWTRALRGLLACLVLGATATPVQARTPALPAAFWSFDDCPSGVAKDGSPGSSCAELQNGAACVPYSSLGNGDNPLGGRAARFDGLDDVAVVPDGPRTTFTRRLTVTAWIKPLSLSGHQTVVSQGGESEAFTVQIVGSRAFVTLAFSDGSMINAMTQQDVEVGAWTHLAVVFSGGCDIRVFLGGEESTLVVNGASCAAVSQSILEQSAEPIYIGNDSEGHGFQGLIDEVRLYNQALGADDIRVLAGFIAWNRKDLFFFGADTNFGNSEYPADTPGPQFYLGQIGGYSVDCEIFYLNRNVFDASDLLDDKTDRQCQFDARMAFAVGDKQTYAYWILRGPEVAPAGTDPLDFGRNEAKNAIKRWYYFHKKVDSELSRIFDDEWLKNARLLSTKVLFADIEPGKPGSLVDDGWPDCALTLEGCDAGTRYQNRQVVDGFLRELADQGFTPGIYTSPGHWSAFFGTDYVPTRRGRNMPFVLWLTGCATTKGLADRNAERIAASFPTVMDNALGGMRPVVWQYHIQKPDLDVAIQKPDKFTPLPATDIVGAPATSSCTCSHLPEGSCPGRDTCGSWEGPEWSSPNGFVQIEYDFNDETAFDLGIVPNGGSTDPDLYRGLVFGGATLRSLYPNYPDSDSVVELDGDTAYLQAEDSGDIAFSYGVAVDAWVWRDANVDEDAIVSKWYGPDQWLLNFFPEGNGKLVFTVRTRNGSYHRVEYLVPELDYLEHWVHVAASYEVVGGRLRLYFDHRLVAEARIEGTTPDEFLLYQTLVPIHVGTAGRTASWSRFNGRIDNVRIWIMNAPCFDC
jgi:hypothetical protein